VARTCARSREEGRRRGGEGEGDGVVPRRVAPEKYRGGGGSREQGGRSAATGMRAGAGEEERGEMGRRGRGLRA
jgi:hypothetical protein